jgi:nucleoside-diphosphate-sugar epimerase
VAIARPGEPIDESLPARMIVADITDREALARALDGVEFVVHLAAKAGGIQFQESGSSAIFSENRLMTDNILEVAARVGVRRVYLASSAVVYRPGSPRPLRETDPVVQPWEHPSPYAWSKVTDEVVGGWWQDSGVLDVVVGRFSNVYGPGAPFDHDRSTVIHALIRRAAETPAGGELLVWGDGSAIRSFVYVEDVAAAVSTILFEGERGLVYNVDNGNEVTVKTLATAVRDAVDPSLALQFDPSKPTGLPYRVTDPTRLKSLGALMETNLSEGLGPTVADYRARFETPSS